MNKAEYKNRIIRIATAVVVLIALTVTAAAEFTKSYRAKRVVGAYEPNGMLFSSNHLVASVDLEFSSIEVDKAEALSGTIPSFDVVVTVCNYAQGNPTQFYGKTINYNLDASIVQVTDDGSGHPVALPATGSLPAVLMNGSPLQARYTGSLPGGVMSEDVYTLTLPRSMLTGEKYYVLLTATPTGGTYTDLAPISKLFELMIRAEATASDWSVIATDDRSNPIDDYAGYNFRLSGSGRGKVTLGWDDTKLEINKVFTDAVGASAASLPAGWTGAAIEFSVDAADVNNYDIQFYPASEGAVTSWSDVAVNMIFEETETP